MAKFQWVPGSLHFPRAQAFKENEVITLEVPGTWPVSDPGNCMGQIPPAAGVTQQWWTTLELGSPVSKPRALIIIPKGCSESEILQF